MTASETAAQTWAHQLAEWAIPEEILEQRPDGPGGFRPQMFAAPQPGTFTPSLSTRRAAEALPDAGVVLDVGCGGGAAAFALVPPAGRVIGVDSQPDMLELFEATAGRRGVAVEVHEGPWPEVAAAVPRADVVVSHNVLYNVADIGGFVRALSDHARRRVVIEITTRHPWDSRREAWMHFWGLERPQGPTSEVAAAAISDLGIDLVVEESTATERHRDHAEDVEAGFWCQHLCLPPERESEVAELVARKPFPRERATLWWDV